MSGFTDDAWRVMSHHVYMDTHNTQQDRALVGRTIKRELIRQYSSLSQFNRVAATRISRKSLERIVKGEPSVDWDSIEYVEGALSLPRDTLAHVNAHDLQGLREIGVDADLIRWVGNELSKNRPAAGTDVGMAI